VRRAHELADSLPGSEVADFVVETEDRRLPDIALEVLRFPDDFAALIQVAARPETGHWLLAVMQQARTSVFYVRFQLENLACTSL
jgi:hypothetical protein